VVSCVSCNYAANMEKATSKLEPVQDLAPEGDGKPMKIHTPGKGAISEIAEFLKISPQQDIKAVAYMAKQPTVDANQTRLATPFGVSEVRPTPEIPVAVFLRGDHTVNETKLLTLLGVSEVR